MKQLQPRLDALIRFTKSSSRRVGQLLLKLAKLFIKQTIKGYRWLDKPHTVRIKKKTIIIGVLILYLACQFLIPKPTHIVYAGTKTPKPAPIYKIPAQKPKLPEPAVQPVQPVEPVQVAPVSTPAPVAPPAAPIISGIVPGCGDNTYANFIYMHESGCSTTITNSLGCLGIGQACPGSKLYAVCPSLDYACENSFFTDYANRAYGGWAGAYAFWIAHSWW